jgi:hypothetical protein
LKAAAAKWDTVTNSPASEQSGNSLYGLEYFYLEAKARFRSRPESGLTV